MLTLSAFGRDAARSLRAVLTDIDDTLTELDNVEEACLTRLAEIGVGT